MYPTLMHEWFEEIWNLGHVEVADKLMLPGAVIHHLRQDGSDGKGPAAFREFFEQFHGAFPDTNVTVHEVIASGDMMASRWTVRAHHQGDHLGFPATRQPVVIEGMSMARLVDGKIAEGWNMFDSLAMMKQLGFQLTAS